MISWRVGSETAGFTARHAVRFGWLVARASWVAAASDPRRPIGWTVPLAAAGALVLAGRTDRSTAWRIASALFVAALYVPVNIAVIAATETVMARFLAYGVWFLEGPSGCAGGRVGASSRSWTLYSVAAWPFGFGSGTELCRAVCAAADRSCIPEIRLTAVTPGVATRLYEPLGFATVGKNVLGQPRMVRSHPAGTASELG